jgi:hypothetical protein
MDTKKINQFILNSRVHLELLDYAALDSHDGEGNNVLVQWKEYYRRKQHRRGKIYWRR